MKYSCKSQCLEDGFQVVHRIVNSGSARRNNPLRGSSHHCAKDNCEFAAIRTFPMSSGTRRPKISVFEKLRMKRSSQTYPKASERNSGTGVCFFVSVESPSPSGKLMATSTASVSQPNKGSHRHCLVVVGETEFVHVMRFPDVHSVPTKSRPRRE